jgi:small subunit ribosomal protein S7
MQEKQDKQKATLSNRRKFVNVSDVKYGDPLIGRFINSIMWDGKKSIAEKIVYKALDLTKENETIPKEMNQVELFRKIVGKIKPIVEVVSRRVRGATYPVPSEVRNSRAEMLALRWLKQGAKARGREMYKALSKELLDAYNDTGFAIKKRTDLHSMAKASRAFSHLNSPR